MSQSNMFKSPVFSELDPKEVQIEHIEPENIRFVSPRSPKKSLTLKTRKRP